MRKTLSILCLIAIGLVGCKKENIIVNKNDEHYSANDFIDSRAIDNNASRSNTISPKSNLKAIIRKIPNTINQYRLILKVDSVEVQTSEVILGVPQFKMVAMEAYESVVITAGLSIPDPMNPDKTTTLFSKSNLNFTKQNENGFFVYASAPFGGPSGTTDETINSFDYELVNISYNMQLGVTASATSFLTVSDEHLCFILPSGKAIEQNPDIEKAKGFYKNNGTLENIEITISGDPAQELESLKFVPDPMYLDPNNPKSATQFPTVILNKTHFNQNAGVAKFKIDDKIVWTVSHDVRGKVYGIGKGGRATGWIQGKATELAR
jgi:hypothetical protein